MAPAGDLERCRRGKPGKLLTCAPFLLECISLLPDFCFVYWKNEHIGPFLKENVVAGGSESVRPCWSVKQFWDISIYPIFY